MALGAAAPLAVGLCLVKYMHFFQLNSYKFAEHKGWIRRNVGPLSFTAILAVAVALFSLIPHYIGWILSSLTCIVYALVSRPKSKSATKKPLVRTPRVKRMFTTEAIICLTFAYAWVCVLPQLFWIGMAILLLFAPYLNLLANIINSPIEKAIANYYVNDAKKMLRSHPNLRVVGVTGSYGKTGTKYALTALLSEKFDVLMTPASYNTPMGVVKTIRSSLRATNEIFVCEMGAKYVGDIDELCRIVEPDIGIITSVGAQHLETFGSLDAIVKTKFELSDYLSSKGCKTVVGYDNENIKNEIDLNRSASDFIKCGEKDADHTISDVTADERGTSFTLTFSDGKSVRLTVSLLGAHNVSNVACAAAVAYELGMTPDEIRLAARRIESAPHRLELRRRGKDLLIDDAYNANPAGTRAALDALSLIEGTRIIVTPGMIELGEESERFNRRLGSDAAKICDYIVLVGERQTAPILAGAREEGFDPSRIRVFERVQDAIDFAFTLPTDTRRVVLIENDLPDNY